jgi:hypothetical protein
VEPLAVLPVAFPVSLATHPAVWLEHEEKQTQEEIESTRSWLDLKTASDDAKAIAEY